MKKILLLTLCVALFACTNEQMPEKDREIFCNIVLDLYNEVYLESFENGEFNRDLYDTNLYIFTMEYDDLKQFTYENYEKARH